MASSSEHDPLEHRSPPLTDGVRRALLAFRAVTPKLDVWERYPDLTAEEDALTDRWACEVVSRECVRFLRAVGIHADLIHAADAEHPWHDEHYWVRIPGPQSADIDFTARQFHNLEHPPRPEHQDLPCPMVWATNGQHPVAGAYRTCGPTPTR